MYFLSYINNLIHTLYVIIHGFPCNKSTQKRFESKSFKKGKSGVF